MLIRRIDQKRPVTQEGTDLTFTNAIRSGMPGKEPWQLTLTGKSEQTAAVWGTNLVTNGNFADGTTGWSASGATHSASSGVLSNTGKGSIYYPYESKSLSIATVIGHKYYVRARVRVTNSVCKNLMLFLSTGTWLLAKNKTYPVLNTWYEFSGIVEAGSTTSYVLLTHYYDNAAASNGNTMEMQYIFADDITANFIGTQPTTAQTDTMLAAYANSWFDGKGQLTTDVVTYTANSPSITYPALNPCVENGNLVSENADASQSSVIAIPYPLRSVSSSADTWEPCVLVDGELRSRLTQEIEHIVSYNSEEITTPYTSTTGGLDAGAAVDYVLETPVETLGDPYPLETYSPTTHIYTTSAVQGSIKASVLKSKHYVV